MRDEYERYLALLHLWNRIGLNSPEYQDFLMLSEIFGSFGGRVR